MHFGHTDYISAKIQPKILKLVYFCS